MHSFLCVLSCIAADMSFEQQEFLRSLEPETLRVKINGESLDLPAEDFTGEHGGVVTHYPFIDLRFLTGQTIGEERLSKTFPLKTMGYEFHVIVFENRRHFLNAEEWDIWRSLGYFGVLPFPSKSLPLAIMLIVSAVVACRVPWVTPVAGRITSWEWLQGMLTVVFLPALGIVLWLIPYVSLDKRIILTAIVALPIFFSWVLAHVAHRKTEPPHFSNEMG